MCFCNRSVNACTANSKLSIRLFRLNKTPKRVHWRPTRARFLPKRYLPSTTGQKSGRFRGSRFAEAKAREHLKTSKSRRSKDRIQNQLPEYRIPQAPGIFVIHPIGWFGDQHAKEPSTSCLKFQRYWRRA